MPNTNTLTAAIPQILAQGLLALRQNAVMPRLVNGDYSRDAAEKGSTIDVVLPSAIATQDVTPSYVAPDDAGTTPTKVQVALDQWKEAPFFLTDKDVAEAMNGIVPMQVSEAIKSIANTVDAYLLGLYKGIYGFCGTPGVTPFATGTNDIIQARKVLNDQLCPLDDRRFVFNTDTEANALNLRAFTDISFSGNAQAINEGKIVRKFGFDWFMDQNAPSHTAGTITTGLAVKTSTVHAIGSTAIVCTTAASTGACALLVGDIVTFAGSSQTYTLTANATQASAGTDVTLNIYPPLKKATAGSEAVTVKASHAINLAFHRDAIAFATRTLMDTGSGLGSLMSSAQDPVSGLALRLEVSRQHKRTRWSFDLLYGAKLVRPELACRMAG